MKEELNPGTIFTFTGENLKNEWKSEGINLTRQSYDHPLFCHLNVDVSAFRIFIVIKKISHENLENFLKKWFNNDSASKMYLYFVKDVSCDFCVVAPLDEPLIECIVAEKCLKENEVVKIL